MTEILGKVRSLVRGVLHSDYPLRYFFARLVVNAPSFFPFFFVHRNGYRLIPSSSSLISGMITEGPDYLRSQEKFICGLLRPHDFFVDVGANIGNLSLSAKSSMQSCRVFALEANPTTFAVLLRNIAINQLDITALNVAVGETRGAVRISNSIYDDWNCVLDNALLADEESFARLSSSAGTPFDISLRTLDSIAHDHQWPSSIRLLKIDVEGYELFVLRGAPRLISTTQLIMLEFGELQCSRYGYTRQDILDFLLAYDFTVYTLDDNPKSIDSILAEGSAIHDASEAPSYCDVIAVNRRMLS